MAGTLYAFQILPVCSNNLTSYYKAGVSCSWGINFFFPTKLTQRRFPNPLFFRSTQEILMQRHIFQQTLFTYCIHISTPLNYISKRAFQQAGGTLFLTCNSEMPGKMNACPSIYKSIERHLRVLNTIRRSFHHCSPRCYLSPQAGLGMRIKLRSTFFCYDVTAPQHIPISYSRLASLRRTRDLDMTLIISDMTQLTVGQYTQREAQWPHG